MLTRLEFILTYRVSIERMASAVAKTSFLFGILFILSLLISVPFFVFAQQTSMSDAANAMCNPWIPQCGCNMVPGPTGCVSGKNTYGCPPGVCQDTTPVGPVLGVCVLANKCEAVIIPDQQGKQGAPADPSKLLDALKGILDKLMQGGGGGGGQPPPPPGQENCPQVREVSTPTVDPCERYVPPLSGSLLGDTTGKGASNSLLDALKGSSQSSGTSGSSGGSSATTGSSSTITVGQTGQQTQTTTTTQVSPQLGQGVRLQSGTSGDIRVIGTGGTIVAGSRDPQANTEVAGFYGGEATVGEPRGIVANLCQNRPWASSVVSYIIPPTFFDGLCSWSGYQVGTPPPPPPVIVPQQVPRTTQPTSPAPVATASTTPTIPPRVDVWAVPAQVSLGSRTSVFWNTQGVQSCTITSPDGSFSENTLSGGAATVPITAPTVFTISCLTPNNDPVTDFVRVELSI